jgi:zinc protease
MNWRKVIFLGLALLLGITLGCPVVLTASQAPRADQHAQGLSEVKGTDPFFWEESWPHERSDLPPDPQVIFGRLSNGFRYALRPNAKPQDRTRLHLIVEAGSLHESEAQRGIAHFLEHMLFNGSTHFAPGELVKYFQKIGMQFGPDANARTGFYDTVYDINLPTSDRQSLQEALLVMQDYAQGALLLPSEIERERGVILAEKRTRDSAEYRAYVASLNFELAGTRFPKRLPIGDETVIRSADRATFTSFYDAWYRPDRMILVMVGDFDPAIARELVEKQFASMAARAPAPAAPPIGTVVHAGLKTFYHHEPEVGSTSVTLQVLDSIAPPPDDSHFQRRQIEEDLANAILQNRLERKVNQPEAPMTEAGAGSGLFLRKIRYGYISADTEADDWQAALTLIEQELRKALQYGFTVGEVARVKQDFRARLARTVAQAQTPDSADLARGLIYSLANDKVFQSPEQEEAFAEPIVASVTAADLHKRLQEVWGQPHRLVLVSGNALIASTAGGPEDKISDVYEQSQEVAVAPPLRREKVVFPYLDAPSQEGAVAERQRFDDIGITMIRWANGVRLNFKSTDYTDNDVQFVLSFGEGRAGVPLEKAALSALAEDVVNESGLGRLDKEMLDQALAGTKTRLRFSLDDDRFTFEGQSAPEELELLFQRLHAQIMDPAFREDAWQLALRRYRQTYQALNRSVDGVLNLYGWRFFSGGDPRFGLPTPEALEGFSAADIENWVAPSLRAGPLELAIVGDVSQDEVVRLAGRYLGTLDDREAAGAASRSRSGPALPEARQMQVPVRTQIDKWLLVMALPTDDIWDIKRTRRLNILAEIVSERLRLRIREEMGAAYSTAAFNWPSRVYAGYGILVVHIPLASDSLDRVQEEVKRILGDIHDRGVSQDELQRALGPTLAGIKDRFRENGYWLHTVLTGATRHPEQLAWSRTIMQDYAGISKTEIDAMARRYLDLTKLAVIQARPLEE